MYEQACGFPHAGYTQSSMRSQSAVEVLLSPDLSRPQTRIAEPSLFAQSRSSSFSGVDTMSASVGAPAASAILLPGMGMGMGTLPLRSQCWGPDGGVRQRGRLLGNTQQLVLLYPNPHSHPHAYLGMYPVLPVLPLPAQAAFCLEHVPCMLPMPPSRCCHHVHHHHHHHHIHPLVPPHTLMPASDDVIRSSSFSSATTLSPARRQRGTGATGFGPAFGFPPGLFAVTGCSGGAGGSGGRGRGSGGDGGRLDFTREELGHFSDDSSYQSALPRRSWSQTDMKLLRQPVPAAEFRPLGHYPHLSRRQGPVRPTHLPLCSSPAPERPSSVCFMGAGAGGGGGAGSRAELSLSDSDSEAACPFYCPALAALGPTGPLARMRISSGSLQLDEDEEDSAKLKEAEGGKAGAGAGAGVEAKQKA